jgi:peptide/nickel transport system substrate-binding protein
MPIYLAHRRPSRKALALVAAVIAGLSVAACTSSATSAGSTQGGAVQNGGTVTFALPADSTPNYIFPLFPPSGYLSYNIYNLQDLLWTPLYWFGQTGSVTMDPALSLADAPVYSDGDTTVTIQLKKANWSDGSPVTSRDVQFWINLVKAEKTNYGAYSPGGFPDNITSVTLDGTSALTLHLNAAYNPQEFTYGQLSLLTAIPAQAWDKESATGPVGNYDETPAGATAVYNFLNAQSKDQATWATNPLWKTVDGAWTLSAYTAQGQATFVPNKAYTGADRPHISELIEEPFTSDVAELNALRSGSVDYGYLPPEDLKQESYFQSSGYTVVPWSNWASYYFVLNYTDSKAAPILDQLYVRQAMQSLINQPAWITDFWGGSASPTYGPAPITPPSTFVSATEKANPYPFNPSHAAQLLSSHGWKVVPNGTTTCTNPSLCGQGITAGEGITLSVYTISGQLAQQEEVQSLQSELSQVGIKTSLHVEPIDTYYSTIVACKAGASCPWDIAANGWGFWPNPYPDPSIFLGTGSEGNNGGFSSPALDTLFQQSKHASTLSAYFQAEDFAATQLPVLWDPTPPNQISVISQKLHGVLPQNPTVGIAPQLWWLSH